ncbi:type III pantothenate kinase [Symbiobacterium terraclitae]|uniref:Type III pantothenate kinase n=1 Tax=Symbiobacterium terraclitae TaxID=557451 RepID=A0ABS4JRZ6_9FIRM|nr:type III pantothenate kinase [Symbiobacterium terraclitae]
MLLAIDVGNTFIVLGVFAGERLEAEWAVHTDPRKTLDEYGLLFTSLLERSGFSRRQVTAVTIASSVPPLLPTLEWMCQKYFHLKPLVIGPGVRTGMMIRYDNPREVGADRIVGAVAAFEKYGGPLIVVDFSTAIILDAISARGEYLGGVIAPGIDVSADALFQFAAKLPRIELAKPERALARNTVHAMQSGIIFGFAGMVDELVERMAAELDPRRQGCKVVATGEQAELLAGECATIQHYDPYLALNGLRIIYDRHQAARGGR